MEYNNDDMEEMRRNGNIRRTDRRDNMPGYDNINDMHGNMSMSDRSQQKMRMPKSSKENESILEDVYTAISEHMCKALAFHEQLADYFCFLGLQGFKRMLEYQYMKECAGKRKLHKRYIDMHHKLIPFKQVQLPQFLPADWARYTTQDIDDNVIPKFVRSALKAYKEWEESTRDCYKEQCKMLMDVGLVTDYEFVKELVLDVEKELKKISRMIENLNGTGYDVNMVHGMQDKYHEKYKKKYNDRFTTKNNYRPEPETWDGEYRRRTREKIGY